jgi:hypothetical protein
LNMASRCSSSNRLRVVPGQRAVGYRRTNAYAVR